MPTLEEIKTIIEDQGASWEDFKKSNGQRLKNLEGVVGDLAELKSDFDKFVLSSQRPGAGGTLHDDADEEKGAFSVMVEGKELPVLRKAAQMARLYRKESGAENFSIGAYVTDVMTGRKAASSAAVVPTFVGAQIVDKVRAASTIVRAGAGTIPIDGPTNLAKITGDPTVYQHTEATDDISESDVTIVPVTLNPKALVAIIPLTLEVVQDSPNLDAVLQVAIANAFAAKVDALTLATILADTNIPTSAAGQDPAVWAKCLEAVSSALGVDQDLPTAMITNTADFMARASQLASTSGTWLGKPPVLARMEEYPTTRLTAGTAIYGGFERAVAIAMRAELRLELVRWGKATSGSHLLVAHMRGDGVVLQPKALYIQEKTVE
ncbi:MAG: phage major capsid protein [Pusillimonas sp.]